MKEGNASLFSEFEIKFEIKLAKENLGTLPDTYLLW